MGVFGTGLRYVLKDFSCWTSTHGVPHIGMANAFWLRTFWILVVLVCIGGFIWQLELLLSKYLAFTVNTETKLQFSERVFPTVSMCHLNPWRLDKIRTDPHSNDLINAYNKATADSGFGFTAGLTGARQQQAAKWTALFSENLYNQTIMAYNYDDLVISCTYNAKTCNTTDFEPFYDPTYGVCQRFNYDAHYSSSRAGPLYGLRMVIRTDQSLYLPWTEAAGVVMVIHGENELPYPDVLGYFSPPGTASSMGVRFLKTSSQPAPYGTCTTQTTLDTPQFKGVYAVETCFRACLQARVVSVCKCYDPAYPHASDGTPTCASGINMLGNMRCVDTLASNDTGFNVIRDCDCPQPCEVETYSVTVSTAQWPSNIYLPTECNGNSAGKPWAGKPQGACREWYKANTLLVEIYYERMNYQVLTESPAYSLVNLVSDVGGQVGLFLGMSIISLIEFVFLLMLICCYCSTHKSRRVELEELDAETRKAKESADAVEAKANAAKGKGSAIYNAGGDPVPPAVTDP